MWTFYLSNPTGDAVIYEGFLQRGKLEYKNLSWVYDYNSMSIIVLADKNLNYPAGRKMWLNEIKECGTEQELLPLALTPCDAILEFTCDNGQCVLLGQRCDDNNDCNDGSDEKQCKQFKLEDPYDKELPPSVKLPSSVNSSGEKECRVKVHIDLLTIDKVNNLKSKTEITYRITFSWIDNKMSYLNPFDDSAMNSTVKDISSAFHTIWHPFKRLMHINSVVGSVLNEEDTRKFKVTVENNPNYFDPESSYEEAVFKGSKGILAASMKFKGTYDCSFDLFRFPFDTQVCSYTLKLEDVNNRKILLIPSNDSVTYHGSRVLEEYEVMNWYSCSRDGDDGSEFIFFVQFQHLYFQQLSTFYLQISLMWGVAYLTLYINLDNFNNRFMGSITGLLVLCALMNSLNQRLPSSGDMKLIDVWNIWFVVQIILIIVMHVIINAGTNKKVAAVNAHNGLIDPSKALKTQTMNTKTKILFPAINFVFIIVYLVVNLSYKEDSSYC